ncbi:ATP-binding protein [Actinophytocola glycyrrhizae]|uniref:ATP-binding protein n=1 Tax=Actinophytocola glycyrrhizae TaxID=2044873 RepID=A0ABV9SD22_9PSEU
MTLPFADQSTLIIPTPGVPTPDEVQVWIQETLAEVPAVPRLRSTLVVEELLANARLHARPPYVLRVALDHTRRALRVFVEDCAPHSGGSWRTGSGLALVDGLSRGWGVERRTRAKTVWAEVAL